MPFRRVVLLPAHRVTETFSQPQLRYVTPHGVAPRDSCRLDNARRPIPAPPTPPSHTPYATRIHGTFCSPPPRHKPTPIGVPPRPVPTLGPPPDQSPPVPRA